AAGGRLDPLDPGEADRPSAPLAVAVVVDAAAVVVGGGVGRPVGRAAVVPPAAPLLDLAAVPSVQLAAPAPRLDVGVDGVGQPGFRRHRGRQGAVHLDGGAVHLGGHLQLLIRSRRRASASSSARSVWDMSARSARMSLRPRWTVPSASRPARVARSAAVVGWVLVPRQASAVTARSSYR